MIYLILGLLAFLGLHSLRMLVPDWRAGLIRRWGERSWKLGFSVLAIAAFVLLLWGYGQARADSVLIWLPPSGLRHVAALLTLPAFVLLVAAYLPANHFKARLGHPMLLAVKLWALAHLLANGWLHAMLLFGGFLLWAVLDFRDARRRDRRAGSVVVAGRASVTVSAVVLGVAAWAGFAFHLHARWIGVAPFGGG